MEYYIICPSCGERLKYVHETRTELIRYIKSLSYFNVLEEDIHSYLDSRGDIDLDEVIDYEVYETTCPECGEVVDCTEETVYLEGSNGNPIAIKGPNRVYSKTKY